MSAIRCDNGRKTYPCTLDETTPKPTLVLDDKHKYTFNTTAEAHSWATRHGYYVAEYIQWEHAHE
jgi:hypothetical protein